MKKLVLFACIFAIFLVGIVSANPIFSGVQNQTVNENSKISITLAATAPDNGTTTITKPSGPGVLTQLDNRTAIWNYTPDYSASTNAQNTVYTVTARAEDGNSTNILVFYVTVVNVNRNPNITGIPSNTTATVGVQYQGQVTASDIDGDQLTYNLTQKPTGMTISSTGLISWTALAAATETVTVVVTDSGGAADSETFSISAVPSAPAIDITTTSILIGSTGQERSIDDEDIIKRASTTIKVKNTGGYVITGLQLTHNINTKYNLTYSGLPASLQPGSEATITIEAKIPEDFDGVNDDLAAVGLNIGSITITGTSNNAAVTDSQAVSMQAENHLEIAKLEVTYETSSRERTKRVSNNGDVDSIIPGSKVTLDVKVENTYPSSGDYEFDIENVDIDIEVEEHSNFDASESESLNKIRANDDDTVTLDFTFDDDVDEYTYNLIVTVLGEDELGAKHGERWEIGLKVERERDDVKVTRLDLGNSELSCDRDTTLIVKVVNMGTDDQDESVLEITNSALGINYRDTFELTNDHGEEDSEFAKTYYLNIGNNVRAGTYQINAKAYINNDDLQHWETVDLIIRDCGSSPTTTQTTTTTTARAATTTTQWSENAGTTSGSGTTAGTGSVFAQTVTGSSTSGIKASNVYLFVLIAANVVLIILILWAVVQLGSRK